MFEVVVIGGGPSGVIASLRARELGATVALIERDIWAASVRTMAASGCAYSPGLRV